MNKLVVTTLEAHFRVYDMRYCFRRCWFIRIFIYVFVGGCASCFVYKYTCIYIYIINIHVYIYIINIHVYIHHTSPSARRAHTTYTNKQTIQDAAPDGRLRLPDPEGARGQHRLAGEAHPAGIYVCIHIYVCIRVDVGASMHMCVVCLEGSMGINVCGSVVWCGGVHILQYTTTHNPPPKKHRTGTSS
jgi:hypothetical protein